MYLRYYATGKLCFGRAAARPQIGLGREASDSCIEGFRNIGNKSVPTWRCDDSGKFHHADVSFRTCDRRIETPGVCVSRAVGDALGVLYDIVVRERDTSSRERGEALRFPSWCREWGSFLEKLTAILNDALA